MKPKDETKIQSIFEATLRLTNSVGIAGLKMSTIAKEAGIASGTLYIYFENKEELLNELYKHLKYLGTLSLINSLNELPVKIQLKSIWEKTLRYRVLNQPAIIFLEQFLVSPFINDESKSLNQQFTDFLDSLLNRGKEELIIKEMDNSILISLLAGYVRDLATFLVSQNDNLTEKMINDSFNVAWDAIKA